MRTVLIIAEVLFLYIVVSGQNLSPQLITSAGEKFSNSYYQMDWSVGELETETFSKGQNILSQGFNQGNFFVTAFQQVNELDVEINVFPNPTNDYIHLEVDDIEFNDLDYQIASLSGALYIKSTLTASRQKLDFSIYPKGIYILTFIKKKSLIKSFIIIKK